MAAQGLPCSAGQQQQQYVTVPEGIAKMEPGTLQALGQQLGQQLPQVRQPGTYQQAGAPAGSQAPAGTANGARPGGQADAYGGAKPSGSTLQSPTGEDGTRLFAPA